MLVVNGIELIAFDKPLQMRELQRDDALRLQKKLHSADEIVEVGYLGKHIVAEDEIRPVAFRHQLLRQLRPEEIDARWNAFVDRDLCYVRGRLDAKDRHAKGQEMLQQISVIAGQL